MMMKVVIHIHITDKSTTPYLSIHPSPSALPPSASGQIPKVPLPKRLCIPPLALLPSLRLWSPFIWMLGTACQPMSLPQPKLRGAS